MGLAEKKCGLKERRVMKEFQENTYPGLVKEIQESAKFEIPIEVDWDTLYHNENDCQYWAEQWPCVYFHVLRNAIGAITSDEMGKDAFQEKIKKIRITNTDNRYGGMWSIDGDTFVFDQCPRSYASQVEGQSKDLQRYLEDNL